MGIPPSQFAAMLDRLHKVNGRESSVERTDDRESALHGAIMGYCDAQWPKWIYIHARTDRRTTYQLGTPDFVLLIPNGKVILIECKRPGGKQSTEQLAWAKQAEILGHTVHLVYSMKDFLALVNQPTTKE